MKKNENHSKRLVTASIKQVSNKSTSMFLPEQINIDKRLQAFPCLAQIWSHTAQIVKAEE